MVGYGARVAMWEQAQAAASRMQIRWSDRVGTAVRFKELGLLLYGIAGERSCEPLEVAGGWLRYQCNDPRSCLIWLYAQLRRMGHVVSPPLRVDEMRFRRWVDSRQGAVRRMDDAELGQDEWVHRMVSDPVVKAWSLATIFTKETDEYDGVEITWPATCRLVTALPQIASHLDDDILAERGGRSAGERVSSLAIAPYASPMGLTAVEFGVHPHRAIVEGPYWEMDHTARSIADGPPRGYHIRYRDLRTGESDSSAQDLVAAEHLADDAASWDPVTQIAIAVPDALRAIPPLEPGQQLDATGRLDPFDAELRALSHVHQDAPKPHEAQPRLRDPAEKYRAAALARLWMLRDKELFEVGDSTPRRVAQRIANDPGYPQPLDPPTLRQLEQEEEVEQTHRAYGTWPRKWSPIAPPDRHLLTGRRRELMLQWLEQVTGSLTTARVSTALDGLTGATAITAATTFLATEGFVQVADLHHNAGAPVAVHDLRQPHRASITVPRDAVADPDGLGSGPIDLVFAHPADGQIATLHADALRGNRRRHEDIRLWFKVLPLDHAMFERLSPSGSYDFDGDDANTGIFDGQFQRSTGGSLRVQLAGLRAFTLPAWTPLSRVWLGADSADQDELHRELRDQAPDWLRPLLPTLTP